jgi:hypothetical protein
MLFTRLVVVGEQDDSTPAQRLGVLGSPLPGPLGVGRGDEAQVGQCVDVLLTLRD